MKSQPDDWLIRNVAGMAGDPESWPYTDDFVDLHRRYLEGTGREEAIGSLHRRLIRLRKARAKSPEGRRLPEFGPRKGVKPSNDPELLAALRAAYDEQPLPVDRLPYTKEFRYVCGRVQHECGLISIPDGLVWITLVNMRKNDAIGLTKGRSAAEKVKRKLAGHRGAGFGLTEKKGK